MEHANMDAEGTFPLQDLLIQPGAGDVSTPAPVLLEHSLTTGPRLTGHLSDEDTESALRRQLRSAESALATERRARTDADRSNRSKAEFLARLSHDLRTPLNAIAGYTDLLLSGLRGPLTDDQRHDLERILRNERHLLALVSSTVDYAKLELGQVRFHIMSISVARMIADAAAITAPQLAARGIALEIPAISRALHARADVEKSRQVLVNLLTNALKATPDHGRIVLTAADDGAGIAIRVTDFGRGIPAAALDRIFEPFVQLEPNAPESMGLGLAISRDLARGMGGDVTVTSTEGLGSSFVLHLPPGDD